MGDIQGSIGVDERKERAREADAAEKRGAERSEIWIEIRGSGGFERRLLIEGFVKWSYCSWASR